MCRFCNMKPKETVELEKGFYVSLYAGKDQDNKLYFMAVESDETDKYYPKYCPECGRLLDDKA